MLTISAKNVRKTDARVLGLVRAGDVWQCPRASKGAGCVAMVPGLTEGSIRGSRVSEMMRFGTKGEGLRDSEGWERVERVLGQARARYMRQGSQG